MNRSAVTVEVVGPSSRFAVTPKWFGRKGEGVFVPVEAGAHKVGAGENELVLR